MTPEEHRQLVAQYEEGPALLREAWDRVPPEARQWRPAPGKWSAHEIIVHCADSETNSVARLRYLLAEAEPLILGYDQDRWATVLDYHSLPVEPAFRVIEAVRANALPILHALTAEQLALMGRHTESGTYGVATWLGTYAAHLPIHARQLERNLEAWDARGSA